MLTTPVRVILVALSLGLDTFAVCVGIGLRERETSVRLRVAFAFAFAEVSMTFIGSLAGSLVQSRFGPVAGYLGFFALVCVGSYMIVESQREAKPAVDLSRGWGLALVALSISLDSLGVGFSIVYLGVPLYVALAAIAIATGSFAALGLTLGGVVGERFERYAGVLAGVILVVTGFVFAALRFYGAGLN